MNYIIIGKGKETIVFLHGWGGNKYSFYKTAKALEEDYRCVLIDFPPFGETIEPKEIWGVEDYSNYVLDILNKLKIKKFYIISHSFGGRVAIFISNKYNDKVRGLVLVDSAGLKPRKTLSLRYKLWKNKRLKKKGQKPKGSPDYEALSEHMKKVFVKVVNEDLKGLLGEIAAKTLIVWGEKDSETPLYMAKILKRKIKDSRLIVYKSCGHFSYNESSRFVGDIKDFLGDF